MTSQVFLERGRWSLATDTEQKTMYPQAKGHGQPLEAGRGEDRGSCQLPAFRTERKTFF